MQVVNDGEDHKYYTFATKFCPISLLFEVTIQRKYPLNLEHNFIIIFLLEKQMIYLLN